MVPQEDYQGPLQGVHSKRLQACPQRTPRLSALRKGMCERTLEVVQKELRAFTGAWGHG